MLVLMNQSRRSTEALSETFKRSRDLGVEVWKRHSRFVLKYQLYILVTEAGIPKLLHTTCNSCSPLHLFHIFVWPLYNDDIQDFIICDNGTHAGSLLRDHILTLECPTSNTNIFCLIIFIWICYHFSDYRCIYPDEPGLGIYPDEHLPPTIPISEMNLPVNHHFSNSLMGLGQGIPIFLSHIDQWTILHCLDHWLWVWWDSSLLLASPLCVPLSFLWSESFNEVFSPTEESK